MFTLQDSEMLKHFIHRQLRVHHKLLRQIADLVYPLHSRARADRLVSERHPSGIELQQSGHNAHQRRLAGAVWPQQAVHAGEGEGDIG